MVIRVKNVKDTQSALESLYNIRKAITGLYEILNIINFDEKDIYYQLGIENLTGLHNNLLDLINFIPISNQMIMKLRELKIS